MSAPRRGPKRDARIVDLYKSGMTMSRVAEDVGMRRSGVCMALCRLGVPARSATDRVDSDRDRRVAELYRDGQTIAQIAAALEIRAGAVTGALKRTGTPTRARGGLGNREDRRSQYAAERAAGKTIAAIARTHGVSRQAVHGALKGRLISE